MVEGSVAKVEDTVEGCEDSPNEATIEEDTQEQPFMDERKKVSEKTDNKTTFYRPPNCPTIAELNVKPNTWPFANQTPFCAEIAVPEMAGMFSKRWYHSAGRSADLHDLQQAYCG